MEHAEKVLVTAISRRVNNSQSVIREHSRQRISPSDIRVVCLSNTDFRISKRTERKLRKIYVRFTRTK